MKRFLQFRLSTILLVVTTACLGLGWLAYARDQARKRQVAIEANEQATQELKDDVAYSDGFRLGVAEAIEEQKTGELHYSIFIPRSPDERAMVRGYRDGFNLVSKAFSDAELERLEKDYPGTKESVKQGVGRMLRAISEQNEPEPPSAP